MDDDKRAEFDKPGGRGRRFAHAVASSYLFLGANVLYTLAATPIALHYLSKKEFGLWALTLQIATYIQWIDLGMWSSVSRILIDHKDHRAEGRYGGAIKSGILVGAAQGAIALLAGLSLVWFLGAWLRVPEEQASAFLWLMIGQVLISSVTFVTRIYFQVLVAWQRMDVWNYSQIVQLAAGFAAMWTGFFLGWGVFSLLLGAAVSWFCGTAICAAGCHRLGIWPRAGEWGQASWKLFGELFSYGADVFLIGLGTQLILSSQTVLVSRELGLEAAALWSVMTKAFTLVSQLVWRGIGNAMPAFAEMQTRREWERLWNRFRALFTAISVLAGVCAVIFAACNGPFITLWLNGRFSWPDVNNVLLGAWLVVLTQQCCLSSLIVSLKEIRGLKYVFLIEGLVFIALALVILRRDGITGMLVCSLMATLLFTWLVSASRVVHHSGTGWKPLLWDWQLPMLRVLAVMIPCWLAMEWLLQGKSDWLRLTVNGGLLAVIGAWAALRVGLPSELLAEIAGKLPPPLKRLVLRLARLACRFDGGPI
jgi:O-antigen/teichoic acid export membrane protein